VTNAKQQNDEVKSRVAQFSPDWNSTQKQRPLQLIPKVNPKHLNASRMPLHGGKSFHVYSSPFAQERSDSSERLFGDVSCSALVVATCASIELDLIHL